MTSDLGHRGPDGAGTYSRDVFHLEATRLAMVDPAAPPQRVYDPSNRIAVVFNGELYSHAQLRAELRWSATGRSDSGRRDQHRNYHRGGFPVSVSELQACLARLYVDESFRELFLRDPAVAARQYALSRAEHRAVAELDRDGLQFFARFLHNKRVKRFRQAYPALFALDHPHIDRLCGRYHALYTVNDALDINRDVTAFGRFIERSTAADDTLPPYVPDLVRHERLYYTALVDLVRPSGGPASSGGTEPEAPAGPDTRPARGAGITVATFRYDVPAIEAALSRGTVPDPGSIDTGEHTILFRHRTPDRPPAMLRIDPSVAALVAACDGNRTLSEVATEVERRLGVSGAGEQVIGAVTRLLGLGVLTSAGADDGAADGHA